MSANTKIEWATHTANLWLRGMQFFVTQITKGQTIANGKPEFRKIGKRLDVVRSQVSTRGVPATLARELITSENIVSPPLVFTRKSKAASVRELPVFVGVMRFPSCNVLRSSSGRTNFSLRFFGVSSAKHRWAAPSSMFTKALNRFWGMLASLECRSATLCAFFNLNKGVRSTVNSMAIMPASVFNKTRERLPSAAFEAPLVAIGAALIDLFYWDANFIG